MSFNKKKSFTNINDFYNYIRKPIGEDKVKTLYQINGIKKEVIKVINDFIYSLLDNIHSTYLGDEYITGKDEIDRHFAWCYNKVIHDFKKEGLDFSKNIGIYQYFKAYAMMSFYKKPEIFDGEDIEKIESDVFPIESNWHKNSWNKIFTYDYRKTQSDLDVMFELHELFDSCLVRY